MLSKKHYQIFAEMIGTSRNLKDFQARLEMYLEADNGRFNIVTFREAVEKAKVSLYLDKDNEGIVTREDEKTVGELFEIWKEAYKRIYGEYPKIKLVN